MAQDEKTQKDIEMENRAKQMRVKYVDLCKINIAKETANIIPVDMARRNKLICIGKQENKITLAMSDPMDIFAIDEVKLRTNYNVEVVLSCHEDVEKALNIAFGEDDSWKKKLESDFGDGNVDLLVSKDESTEEVVIDQPIIIAVNKIISTASEKRASDIHIEPFEDEIIVRYRIDGVLHEVMNFPKTVAAAMISRIKILSNLDIAEKRIPQDGRIHLRVKDKGLDFRVSTIPTLNGESVVMRILDRSALKVNLEDLGFEEKKLKNWEELIDRPHGIILVTGPTGSGKSTTLYATLNYINKPDVKIVTIEDPIEYNLKGIIQVQTHQRIGLTFATGLRAFLRQDPDVMMVGEIRDKETATIAIESALTGHLVLSTLHTNDSVGSITRLMDMVVEPFLISSTMIGVIAQRLVRKVCQSCKEPNTHTDEIMKILAQNNIDIKEINLLKGKGCQTCDSTGYKGRLGIYELLTVTENIKEMILKEASNSEILAQARKEGLITLFEDGLKKIAEGKTTFEELCRVTME